MADLDREPIREGGPRVVYRHRLPTRIWHWLNAAVILVMLMTGLMIFNAHPRLYWGQYGANPDYSWLQIGDRGEQGYLRVGTRRSAQPGSWASRADRAIRQWTLLSPAGSPYRLIMTSRWLATGT